MVKKNKTGKYIVCCIIGIALLAVGLLLVKGLSDAEGVQKTLPYLCIGIGAGIFGGNLGTVVKIYVERKDPQAAKQARIEEKDERNRMISDKAKAKSFDMMLLVYAAIVLAFALMQVNLFVVLTLVAGYLFVVFSNVYYLAKYQKKL